MMKRIFPLMLVAGLVEASRLGTSNHHGVEEIGDHIEFFAPEQPDRDVLLQRRMEANAAPVDELSEHIGDDVSDEVDQYNRREVSCTDNEAETTITFNAADGSSYIIKDSDNNAVVTMPASGSTFSGGKTYTKNICLPPGQYTLRVKGGNKAVDVSVGGSSVLSIGNQSASVVEQKFSVMLFSGRGSMLGSGSSQTFTGDSGFVSKSCYNVKVYTKIDKYGKETSWKITKKGRSSAIAQMGATLGAYQDKTVNAGCLQPGDYTLTFTDIDGICCKNGQGEFQLIIDGETLLAGGQFIGSVSHDFKIGHDWGQGMVSRDWEFLQAHNARRADYHTRCTSNYCNKKARLLKWSEGLAADAKVYAEKLLDTCEINGIKHDPGIEQGENLAKNKGRGAWGELYPADKIVKRFVDNEAEWPWHDNAHFTQALWYATKYLGCGEAVKTMSNGDTCRMQVCRYAKAGNCEMGKYNSEVGRNFEKPMMLDDTPCGPVCPPEGCYPG